MVDYVDHLVRVKWSRKKQLIATGHQDVFSLSVSLCLSLTVSFFLSLSISRILPFILPSHSKPAFFPILTSSNRWPSWRELFWPPSIKPFVSQMKKKFTHSFFIRFLRSQPKSFQFPASQFSQQKRERERKLQRCLKVNRIGPTTGKLWREGLHEKGNNNQL